MNKLIKTEVGSIQDVKNKVNELIVEDAEDSRKLNELVENAPKLLDHDLLTSIKETFQDIPKNDPVLDSDSNSSKDHYFPKIDKGKGIDLSNLSQSEIERRASNVQLENTQMEQSVETKVIEEQPKSVFGSLLDQIRQRRNDSNVIDDTNKENIQETIQVENTQVEQPIIEEVKPKSIFGSLFDSIKSRRNDSYVIDDTKKESL